MTIAAATVTAAVTANVTAYGGSHLKFEFLSDLSVYILVEASMGVGAAVYLLTHYLRNLIVFAVVTGLAPLPFSARARS